MGLCKKCREGLMADVPLCEKCRNDLSNPRLEAQIKTAWENVPFEDQKSIVGGGRAGYEARRKHNYGDRR